MPLEESVLSAKRRTLLRCLGVTALIASPMLAYQTYVTMTALPSRTSVALSEAGGLYRPIAQHLADRLANDIGLGPDGVARVDIRGSLDALRGLQCGYFDFALYQSGVQFILREFEFDELDSHPTQDGEVGDDHLSLEELQWRRPEDEDPDEQALMTRQATARLDADHDDLVSRDEYFDTSDLRLVANLYSEVVHFIVPIDSHIETIGDLKPDADGGRRTVAIGNKYSGGYAVGRFLLREFGLSRPGGNGASTKFDVELFKPPADEEQSDVQGYLHSMYAAFERRDLDAALITMGMRRNTIGLSTSEEDRSATETVVARLLGSGKYRLLPIEYGPALQANFLLPSVTSVPAGFYRNRPASAENPLAGRPLAPVVPPIDVPTISVRAKLITRVDVDHRLVAAVAETVLREDFHLENGLVELFAASREDRVNFAQEKPEFVIHRGALSVFSPEEFDMSEFESWDALYSLLASAAIGAYLLATWLVRRRERRRGHALDRWIELLLEIEKRQLGLDAGPKADDEQKLQKLLDEVAALRMRALATVSTYDLKDDPAGQYFVDMCHALSNKINAKLSRQRLDTRFDELIETFRNNGSEARSDSKPATP
ncbi:MAG: hypothetical protein AAF961_04690 [Planctomycetota bacterium]